MTTTQLTFLLIALAAPAMAASLDLANDPATGMMKRKSLLTCIAFVWAIAQGVNAQSEIATRQPDGKGLVAITGEILYNVRTQTKNFAPRLYAPGKYTVKAGKDKPDTVVATGVEVV